MHSDDAGEPYELLQLQPGVPARMLKDVVSEEMRDGTSVPIISSTDALPVGLAVPLTLQYDVRGVAGAHMQDPGRVNKMA